MINAHRKQPNSSYLISRVPRRWSILVTAVVAACVLWASQTQLQPEVHRSATNSATEATGAPGSAEEALEGLSVREWVPAAGYDRDLFGPEWSDDVRTNGGGNGCDSRSDLLRRDLFELVIKPGTQGCVPLSGTLLDPFTGKEMPFERGQDSASLIHVDHLVSLAGGSRTGALELDAQTRRDFANDPLNLWVVSGSQNMSKSDDDAASWLPPHPQSRCPLVAAQIAVKTKYGLWVTPAEAEAMRSVLQQCPAQELPDEASARIPALSP